MLGGIRELVPRSRAILSLVVPAIVVAVGIAFFVPAPPQARTLAVTRPLPAPPVTMPSQLTPQYIRSLPHNEKATATKGFIKSRPPRHLSGVGLSSAGIPAVAIEAYEHAARVLAKSDKACHLSWADLAAIGRVESDNGRTWGGAARVSKNGTLTPPILGPVLDGRDGFPAYKTPDRGRLEHGGKWERAVGPMQFLPSTWFEYAQDGNGDGVKNPQNFWDAALTTGVYLCANGGNLASSKGFDSAVLAYNHSRSYLQLVRAWARFYQAAGAKRLEAATPDLLAVGISPLTRKQLAEIAARQAGRALRRAVAVTSAQPSFVIDFSVVTSKGGHLLADGSGIVDPRAGASKVALQLAGVGRIHLLRVGPRAGRLVKLPSALSRSLGEEPSSWLSDSPALLAALPAGVRAGISLATVETTSGIDTLAGGTKALHPAGPAKLGHSRARAYKGTVELVTAAKARPESGSELATLGMLAGTRQLSVTALVATDGRIRSLTMTLPELKGLYAGGLKVTLHLSAFGGALPISAPQAASYPPSSTTTSTSSTTTTSSSTTTTTSTTTTSSTTTTTTTTAPPTTTSPPPTTAG